MRTEAQIRERLREIRRRLSRPDELAWEEIVVLVVEGRTLLWCLE